jgi:hypothetical protein
MNFILFFCKQNKNKIKCHTPQIICFSHYKKHKDLENYYQKQLLLFHSFINFEDSQLDGHPTWHFAYMTHEKFIIQTISNFIYLFRNLNKNLNK